MHIEVLFKPLFHTPFNSILHMFHSTISFLKDCPICSFHNHYLRKNEKIKINLILNSFIYLMIKTLKYQNVNNDLSNYKENELRLKVNLKTCSFFFPLIIN